MAYSPWNKRPPVLPHMTREFLLKSGDTVTLTLQKLGSVQRTEMYELRGKLIERFITGDTEFVDTGGKSGEGPIPFPSLGGEVIQPTETMIQGADYVYTMQVGLATECISPEEWIGFQAVEDEADWNAIQAFAREVNNIGKPANPKDADVPNVSGADTKDSSDPSSTDTNSTPKSPSE